MLLTSTQAEALYRAMLALNSVSGRLDAVLDVDRTRVREKEDGRIWVEKVGVQRYEAFGGIDEFAAAYGLQPR